MSTDGLWTSKGSGNEVRSHSVGRRDIADIQAGRSLLSEEAKHLQSNLRALTYAQVPWACIL